MHAGSSKKIYVGNPASQREGVSRYSLTIKNSGITERLYRCSAFLICVLLVYVDFEHLVVELVNRGLSCIGILLVNGSETTGCAHLAEHGSDGIPTVILRILDVLIVETGPRIVNIVADDICGNGVSVIPKLIGLDRLLIVGGKEILIPTLSISAFFITANIGAQVSIEW